MTGNFFLHYLDEKKGDGILWNALVEECDHPSIKSQIAIYYFVGCDYEAAPIDDTNFNVGQFRKFLEKYHMDYEFEISTEHSIKWYFPDAPEDGSDMRRRNVILCEKISIDE